MTEKKAPFSLEELKRIALEFPTPFHIYDEKAILDNLKKLHQAFAWADFKEYFAVKATPNPFLMKIMRTLKVGADCSSLPELLLAEKVGILGEEIMFTSNNTPAEEYRKATDLGAIINFDDISHLTYYEKHIGRLPELVCFRYNPGRAKEGNLIIGRPEEAKYGFTREQLFAGYRYCRDRGVRRFGIHTMVASNELDHNYFIETAEILFALIRELTSELKINFEFANLGGGIGIPYRPEEQAVDLAKTGAGIQTAYENIILKSDLPALKLCLECGRMVTGPYGYLVTQVLHRKETYKTYIGVDATMANLMRPALYGAYHHITVAGREKEKPAIICDVTGSLCENNDKFAINRELPRIEPGDYLIIHDAGAHGHAMGFNYNGKLRSAELLLRADGSIMKIRRAETIADHFATLDFKALEEFQP
ncbi:MAG: diaminopimelate decarboxylase [Deltaproteobacteria bacterium]|nr:diaminopimelate decarboxylase [Deltaproteobacteria bacterium]